ncbi:helix-turn-helix transcriptional regulator [Burkholderia ubonensis]|uniref:helix-turn-helix transcriptional regulator n=1 Tax=Burkholderia ubonensis TaxID=101571 RepID=UPI0005D85158|nr:LuxR family transcriptional regulator [Burkholderia ubonensis]AJX14084.1 bacterial regulatory s, luxR family protein [Burkholderia ubonensis MSMB22]KVD60885.1 LuxR family transcriptional regulator [Burkholderia ubonensis]KVO90862.1 LuxR family transcriptional regulator [Burkholderia ubonensis]KVV53653.1 LuxR family transcriptional regulator [Burkholderia ubonensis]KVW25796.1 LuxR family transcriptional regulator [Burkholderia ubonensis]
MSDIALHQEAVAPQFPLPSADLACRDGAQRPRPVQVVWCDDVKRGELGQPHAPRLGVADTLAHAQSTAERNRIVTSLLHLTGFSTFAYFALEFAHERVESLYLHEAFTPATYRGDYVRHSHHDVDPRTLGARVCNMPIVWDLQQLRRQHRQRDNGASVPSGALDGFLQTMQDDGMCSGIMYSMAVPGTRLHAFMSFTAPRRTREWITPATLEQALSIGLSVHKFASPQLIATSRERTVNGLTPFEQELLIGIAEGASDKEIGRRLDTSAHNVDYHLRKLRKRFGVANRIQLTYLTSKLELI